MTLSIVARDPATGRYGVATAGFELAVGARVPHVTGHGALAVQARTPAGWAPAVLAALASGVRAGEAVSLLRSTPGADRAQLAVVDPHGGAAVLSGSAVEPDVSDAGRAGVCAAAHLTERRGVARVAVLAYVTSTAATFEERLLDALSAADRMGTDVRGRQSAALRTVGSVPAIPMGDGARPPRPVDLRVDDARDPVGELRRLHRLDRAHALLAASRDARGRYRDPDLALAALDAAPDDLACLGGAALALLRSNRSAEATPLLRRLGRREPRTAGRLHRLVLAGLLEEHLARAALRVLARGGDGDRTAPAGIPLPAAPGGAPATTAPGGLPLGAGAAVRTAPTGIPVVTSPTGIPLRSVPAGRRARPVAASTRSRPAG